MTTITLTIQGYYGRAIISITVGRPDKVCEDHWDASGVEETD